MRYPQIVVYETAGWLAAQVSELAVANSWLVRESRQPEAALHLLREVRPAVLFRIRRAGTRIRVVIRSRPHPRFPS